MKRFLSSLAPLLLLPWWAGPARTQGGSGADGMGGGMMNGETMAEMMGGFMIIPLLIGLLILIVLVLAAAALVKYLFRG